MKEAAGEANITVITIVLIAVVLAVGTLIVNSLLTNTARKSACSALGGTMDGKKCYYRDRFGNEQNKNVTKCANGKSYYVINTDECDQS